MSPETAKRFVTQFAEAHLEGMKNVPWESFANHIRERFPRSGGEGFGCEEDGQYFDVGDRVAWLTVPDGDILFTAYASTKIVGEEISDSCTTVIARNGLTS